MNQHRTPARPERLRLGTAHIVAGGSNIEHLSAVAALQAKRTSNSHEGEVFNDRCSAGKYPHRLTQDRNADSTCTDTITSSADLFESCLSFHFNGAAAESLSRTTQAIQDWDAVLNHAQKQRLGPLLYTCLRNHADGVPVSVIKNLERLYVTNVARQTRLTDEMFRVLHAFRSAGLDAIPFKGPTLANLLYDDPTVRPYDDLDFILSPANLKSARDLLSQHGYTWTARVPQAAEADMIRGGGAYIMQHNKGKWQVDLATSIAHDYFSLNLPATALSHGQQSVTIENQTAHTLSSEFLFLMLCAHGTKHLWQRLAWIADVAAFITSRHAPDWKALSELAEHCGARKMLCLAVALAESVCKVEPPTQMRALIESEKDIRELTAQVEAGNRTVTHGIPEDDLSRLRIHLSARERLRDRLRYLVIRGIKPSYNDWRSMPLPRCMFPVYYITRPVRLALAAIRKSIRNAYALRY